MKEILVEIGTSVACLMIAAILVFVAKWFHIKCQELKAKTDNETLKALIDKVDYIVQLCVEATNQTFVDDLKKNDNFTDENKTKAFDKTFQSIENMLTEEDRQQIVDNFGDLSTFLQTSVENYIKNSKSL